MHTFITTQNIYLTLLVSIQFHNNSKHQFDTLESVTDKVFCKIKTTYLFFRYFTIIPGGTNCIETKEASKLVFIS